jgi:GNAT superfamily N-acetyltransferase
MTGDEARARFEEASQRHLTGLLAPGIELRPVAADENQRQREALWREVERPAIDPTLLISEEDGAGYQALDSLRGPRLEHHLLWVAGDQVVGSYWGFQDDFARYYMCSSVVRADHRGRGLYSAFLQRVIAAARDSGFRELYSRHRADNNAVLVPKMKAGFLIAGFEVTPRFGLLVHLRRYLHAGLGDLFAHRIDGSNAAALRAAGLPLP